MALPVGLRGVLTDIEGTTTAISFVYQTLFPYAAARLDAVCARAAAASGAGGDSAGDVAQVAAAVDLLRGEYAAEAAAAAAPLPDFGDGAPYAHYLMAQDRKSTGLKALQGLIWKHGYDSGRLVSQVFDDVPPALAAWRAAGLRLRVFSSGSRQAQQQLFARTEHGDLTALFDGFHDTTTGPKREVDAYRKIAAAFALPPATLLFLSDVAAELDAAAAAGYATALVVRPGNPAQPAGPHPVVRSFDQLLPDAAPAAAAALAGRDGAT